MSAGRAWLAAFSIAASIPLHAAGMGADAFADASAWTALASDQVEASLRRPADGKSLCLEFDFHGVSGYAAMRRTLAIDYPDNYAFGFRVRGDAPGNTLQLKLGDASGDNIWWARRTDFEPPHEWQDLRFRKREITFAWGPAVDRALRHSDMLELTVYAGSGGRGEVCFDAFAMHALPPPPSVTPPVAARASSARRGAPAANVVDGNPATVWRSRRAGNQALTLDLGLAREFGGIVLHWVDRAHASAYDIDLSDDRTHWRRVRRVTAGNGGDDPIFLPDAEARYIRLTLREGQGSDYALAEVEIRDPAFGASANRFLAELAARAPRSHYPRAFHDEQTYWTVVGVDGGHDSGLLSEDGALEIGRGGFSIEPFIIDESGRLAGWADVVITHSLADGYLPMPRVSWQLDAWRVDVDAFALRTGTDRSQLVAGYTVDNTSDRARALTLALALRPFQVNPSVQFLNTPGGVSPIRSLAQQGMSVLVDGKARVHSLARPDAFIARPFDAGSIVEELEHGVIPAGAAGGAVRDDTGLASAALLYRLELAPHEQRTIALAMPLDGDAGTGPFEAGDAQAWFSAQHALVAADWHRRLDTVRLRLPAQAPALAQTLRTALAHILVSRDGAALRPGTRSYARSWIRDGAMMAEALLRLGREDAAQAYFDWYAPYQFRSGKVPCCVDQRGSDPVPENDSHGELIHLASDLYRYTGNRERLAAAWPHVDAATRYMDTLRNDERTLAAHDHSRAAFSGLMPASISHEGYSAKPMHSYWDDFWALLGYKDAAAIATALGRDADAARLRAARDELRVDLDASFASARAAHAIDYLPGCAELGDFDATSTTIALSPGGELAALPQDALNATFERYWKEFIARRDGRTEWKAYTPYEWRAVGTFVRLGWRERALAAIEYFMRDRRPVEWNQWAEVVGKDPRESRFVGDMPHGWVASDFIRSVLDLFAWERDRDGALVLASGIPDDWLGGEGIAIDDLRTPYGRLSYTLRRDATGTHLHIDGNGLPPGGFVYAPRGNLADARVTINGKRTRIEKGELRITVVPAEIAIAR
jgi:hypothetical protein